MKKQTLYYTALLPLIAATLLASAWWSLHDNRALILRDQPLLQLSEAQKQVIRDLKGDITLEAYVRNNPRQRRDFADLVAPYKQLHPRLHLQLPTWSGTNSPRTPWLLGCLPRSAGTRTDSP